MESDQVDIVEEPTNTVYGVFTMMVQPLCGEEQAHCKVLLRVEFGATESETVYILDSEKVEGMSEE
jgi:hypothetical protein